MTKKTASRTPSSPRKRRSTAPAPMMAAEPTKEQIAVRAFEIYVDRGGRDGSPETDWFRAEAELRAQMM